MVQAEWIPKTLGLGFDQPYTWIVALGVGIVVGAAIGGLQGFLDRVRRRAVVHRDARRPARLARPHLPLPAGPDHRPARRDLPAPGRRRRRARSGPSSAGSSGASPAWGSSTRSGPAGAGAGATTSRSARSGPRSLIGAVGDASWSSGPSAIANAYAWPRSARQGLRRGERDPVAGGWADHPDRHRLPGPHHARGRPRRDLSRDPPPLRPLRLRHRRQPGGRGARRHQRAPDDHPRRSC